MPRWDTESVGQGLTLRKVETLLRNTESGAEVHTAHYAVGTTVCLRLMELAGAISCLFDGGEWEGHRGFSYTKW